MAKKIIALFLCSLLLLCGCNKNDSEKKQNNAAPTSDNKEANLIHNGTFDTSSVSPWTIFKQGGSGTLSVEKGELKANISSSGSVEYAFQAYQDLRGMYKNAKYKLSFDAHCTIEREIEVRIQINGGDYHAYFIDHPKISKDKKTYEFEFEMKNETDPAPRFAFNLGTPKSQKDLPSHDIFFDNIKLVCTDSSKAQMPKPNENLKDINVNQIGYKTDYNKIAVARGDVKGKEYKIINKDTDKEVKSGKLDKEIQSKGANETVYPIDFSDIKEKGTYYIKIGKMQSFDFKIGDDVYDKAYNDSFKMFYTQRSGMKLTSDMAGKYAHEACYTRPAKIYGTDTEIDVSGGWHDAGDYGRYVAPGAKAVTDLLLAYQFNPKAFTDNMGIPESNNGTPDILDEAKYELDWMFKMQESKTGGVYHKVTTADFCGIVAPEDDIAQLYVYPVSQTATADFCAVMAIASKVYKDFDKNYSDKCMAASLKAWEYVKTNNNPKSFTNPSDCTTGEYPDGTIKDEQAFASAALYSVTGDNSYLDYSVSKYSTDCHGLGWADMSTYANYLLIKSGLKDKKPDDYNTMYTYMKKRADKMVSASKTDGYFSTLGIDYFWGSNMGIANDAMFLIMMNDIEANPEYKDTSRKLMDYLFGTNANSMCFLTGNGSYSPQHPHHRMSQKIGTPVPGMLVGGPDKYLEDPFAKGQLMEIAPAKCYVDSDQAYSLNEITIYWNSPLIFDFANID